MQIHFSNFSNSNMCNKSVLCVMIKVLNSGCTHLTDTSCVPPPSPQQPPSCVRTPADARPQPKHPESQETHLAVQRHRGPPHGRDALCGLGPRQGPKPGFKPSAGLCCCCWEPPARPGPQPPQGLLYSQPDPAARQRTRILDRGGRKIWINK